jgi:hypothetical protein
MAGAALPKIGTRIPLLRDCGFLVGNAIEKMEEKA